jgi:hypothetical protein
LGIKKAAHFKKEISGFTKTLLQIAPRFLDRSAISVSWCKDIYLLFYPLRDSFKQMRKFEQPDEMGAYDRWESLFKDNYLVCPGT